MTIPSQEAFFLDVRRAARMMHAPSVDSDSDQVDTDAVSRILAGAAIWLTPKVIEHFDMDDFEDWPEEERLSLGVAVDAFQTLSAQVDPNNPVTVEQFLEGSECLKSLIGVLGPVIRKEWQDTVDLIEQEIESWCKGKGWKSKREERQLVESILGEYDVTDVLFNVGSVLFVLSPVARFVSGATGAFDLAAHPSYEAISIYRNFEKTWMIEGGGDENANQPVDLEWNKDNFVRCVDLLQGHKA